MFEHFVVVGLHSNANVEATEAAFARRKTWETEMANSNGIGDVKKHPYRGPPLPSLDPQVCDLLSFVICCVFPFTLKKSKHFFIE